MFVGIIQSQTRSLISFEQEIKTHHYLFKIKVRNETRNENRNRPQPKGRFRIDSLFIFLNLILFHSKLFHLISYSRSYYKY